MAADDRVLASALKKLAASSGAADAEARWPEASWAELRRAGVLEWSIPRAYGGLELESVDLLDGYEAIASACLTSAFILSQREAAVRRIRDGANEALRAELLPRLRRDEIFATVGLSQLTTSRQHGGPALAAKTTNDGYVLDGYMPWVTGAPHTDFFITGAVLDDGRQILAALHRQTPGVSVGEPLDLMALEGSLTAEVRCDAVEVERRWLLAGPSERVLATTGKGGTGGLETSCLAVGLAGAAIGHLAHEGESRPEWQFTASRLARARDQLRGDIHRLAEEDGSAEDAARVRGRANALVVRSTQAALIASKGAGFLRSHPAQRWARQALFFLVWSCPRPAAEATLAHLVSEGDSCF